MDEFGDKNLQRNFLVLAGPTERVSLEQPLALLKQPLATQRDKQDGPLANHRDEPHELN